MTTSPVALPAAGRARPWARTMLGLSYTAALLSLACFGLHVAMLFVDDGSMFAMIATMLLISAVCLGCSATMLCGDCGRREQLGMLAASAAMVVVHTAFDLLPGDGRAGPTGMSGMSHMPGMAHAGSMQVLEPLMQVALAVAVVQTCLMAAALLAPRLPPSAPLEPIVEKEYS